LGFGSNIEGANTWNHGADECQSNLFLEHDAKLLHFQNYLDNIRTEEELSIYEQEEIELGTGSLNAPQSKSFESHAAAPTGLYLTD
jgi:hypothetical protein